MLNNTYFPKQEQNSETSVIIFHFCKPLQYLTARSQILRSAPAVNLLQYVILP